MDGPIRREVIVGAQPQDVWTAITTAERLGAWFGAEVEVEPRPDGPLSVRFPDGSVRRGVVEAVEPPGRFVFRWRSVEVGVDGIIVGEGSTVEFLLSPADDGHTRVVVTEHPAQVGSPKLAGPLPTELAVHA